MSLLGNLCAELGGILVDSGRRGQMLAKLRAFMRKGFAWMFLICVVFFVLVEVVGERNLFTVLFLFLPPQVWFIPLAMFGGVGMVLWDWRLLGMVLGGAVALVWFHFDWEFQGGKQGGGGEELVVMTFNRGQRTGSLRPFKGLHQPDLIAMQEAGNHSRRYLDAEGYEDLGHGEDIGEFMLLSKFPIKDKGLLEFQVGDRRHRVAAWFVVDFRGEDIVVYNVHMDTPRDQLRAFRRGAFLRGLWPFSEQARSYQGFWDRQIELSQRLKEHVMAEARPVIVVGDFNMPDHGFIYRRFCRGLQDAHEVAGHGFGWTFPGTTRNPLSLFGPWLRIDHQFAGPTWRVLDCRAETGRKSQHLAVVARFERDW